MAHKLRFATLSIIGGTLCLLFGAVKPWVSMYFSTARGVR